MVICIYGDSFEDLEVVVEVVVEFLKISFLVNVGLVNFDIVLGKLYYEFEVDCGEVVCYGMMVNGVN